MATAIKKNAELARQIECRLKPQREQISKELLRHGSKHHTHTAHERPSCEIGFQTSTIYEMIANRRFPAPFKLTPGGRAAGWFEATIDEWLATQAQDHETRNPE